jgi:hypothetical protein
MQVLASSMFGLCFLRRGDRWGKWEPSFYPSHSSLVQVPNHAEQLDALLFLHLGK